ncbi:cysteine desulfurase family protein [Novosphingobium sp.]|uniref:cysteine desulfurase family protein n=1 Tax=Novosphingobium sp. TaxID=1874826 RepID=UPI0035AE79B2
MIYLDYQATTPLAPEAREAMLRWLADDGFANPHSAHAMGRAAKAAVEVAREQVAALFPPGGRVVFTGSATEAINLAIRGGPNGPVAVSAIEHAAVRDTARWFDADHELAVDADGLIDPEVPFPEGARLVAAMQVNNEIGTIQPVERLAERARAAGAWFLCDAVQGAGKLAAPAGADLIAVSAHKLHGPKGIGALWVRDGLQLSPIILGGGQEGGLRSGTLSPALCAGFGAAAKLALERREEDAAHVEMLWNEARAVLNRWTMNGSKTKRYKGNLNLRLNGLDVARLMSDCRRIMFSAGSACASGSGRPSHVLRALGLSDGEARSSIRLGFGRYTTRDELIEACRTIDAAAKAQGV